VGAYFWGCKEDTIEDGSLGKIAFQIESDDEQLSHNAGEDEMAHLVYIACYDWQQNWNGGLKLKEPLMLANFFAYIATDASSMITAQTYILTSFPASPHIPLLQCLLGVNPNWCN